MSLLHRAFPPAVSNHPQPSVLLGKAMVTTVAVEARSVRCWPTGTARTSTTRRGRRTKLHDAQTAVLFPNTAPADADTTPKTVPGVPVNQLTGQAFVLLPVLAVGRQLARSTTRRGHAQMSKEPKSS